MSASSSPSVMRVVVTGGAGFIGTNLCRALVRDGFGEVVAFDNLSSGDAENIADHGIELVEADIRDRTALDRSLPGATTVVHLAARPSVPRSIEDPVESHLNNTWGTLQVLEAARRAEVPHIVVASSSSVYGANPTLPKSEDLKPSPLSPYAAQKLATEAYALAHGHCFDLDVLVLRFFNVFGPYQPAGHAYAAVVPAFIDAALAGRPLPVHGDGLQTRDFTFVDSVVAVLLDALVRRVSSAEPVNLAFGGRSTLVDLVAALEVLLGRPLERQHLPPRPGDVGHSQADQRRLRELFPAIEPIPLLDGLLSTLIWWTGGRQPGLHTTL
jgi:UDP-glucose 4-epimerase